MKCSSPIKKSKFSYSFEPSSHVNSVPSSVLVFMGMLIDGSNLGDEGMSQRIMKKCKPE